MVGVLPSGGLDISGQLLDQTIKPCKVSLESLVLFFRQKDILIFSKGQISICCFYQVVLFQVVLITLVRCAFLRNHTGRFCTVVLGTFAYCDSAILRSMRNLEQNTVVLGKSTADTFHELCVFQFGESACYTGNATPYIFALVLCFRHPSGGQGSPRSNAPSGEQNLPVHLEFRTLQQHRHPFWGDKNDCQWISEVFSALEQ